MFHVMSNTLEASRDITNRSRKLRPCIVCVKMAIHGGASPGYGMGIRMENYGIKAVTSKKVYVKSALHNIAS